MPRKSSPYDDPFADLFGKLPDPRERGAGAPGPMRTPAPEPWPDDDTYQPRPSTSRLPLLDISGTPSASAATSAGTFAMTTESSGTSSGSDAEAPRDRTPEPPAPASGSAPGATPAAGSADTGSTPAVPLSRRAAREAAARAATGATPTQQEAQAPSAAPTPPSTDESPVAPAAGTAAEERPATPPTARDGVPEPATPTAAPPVTFESLISGPIATTTPAAASAPDDRVEGRPEPGGAATGASLEDLFSGRSTSDDLGHVPPPPDKRKRRVGGWIALAIVLIFLGGIAAGGLWVWNTYEDKIRAFMGWEEPKDYEDGQATGEALVTISSGDTGSTISQSLYDAGVTKTPEAFYDHLVETAQNPTFYPGVYRLQTKMTSEAALAALQDPLNKLENSALVREGLTVEQTLPILSEGIGIPLEDFQAAVKDPSVYGITVDPAIAEAGGQPLEGWLFPAMYTFDPGATATDVIQTMVDRTVESLDNAGVPAEDRERVLTIASIIQREARFEDDFYKVSRVIQNRLDPDNQETFGKLQMDSTAQFGFGEMHDGTASSSQEALDDPNPWNTYFHAGLPIGPIANPGDTAIDAAMHPADGPWLYFVTVNMDTGETVFTETYTEHLKYVDQMQSWCSEHPDSGC